MKVALVHDYLKEYGGAERVLDALHEIFPQAPVYTAYWDHQMFKGWDIRTSWLQNIPFADRLLSPFRIFAPVLFESFDLKEFDVVISSCNTYFAKAVKVRPDALHISYIHTPPRYLYGYATSFNYKKHMLTRIAGEIMNHFLRLDDFVVSQRPDILVANSKNVKERIKKFYRRDSVVVYPPVEIKGYRLQGTGDRKYFLAVSRLVRGKGVDTVIMACGKLGLPLKVVGSGPELANFQFLISNFQFKNIEFLGFVSDDDLPSLYAEAKALVIASEDEDFGITAVEAQAAGIPVIAPASGGYLETVINSKTGVLYGSSGVVKVEDLVDALEKFSSKGRPSSGWDETKFRAEDCRQNAQKFSLDRFKKEMLELIEKNIKHHDKS